MTAVESSWQAGITEANGRAFKMGFQENAGFKRSQETE